MYIITPSDQISQDLSYFSGPRTSGAETVKILGLIILHTVYCIYRVSPKKLGSFLGVKRPKIKQQWKITDPPLTFNFTY